MKFRSLSPIVPLFALGLAACRDPVRIKATQSTQTDSFVVYAITGTSVSFPTTYLAAARAVTILTGAGNFDVAFDIDAQGKAVLYPTRLVVSAITFIRDVGLQKVAGDFETVVRAPSSGYITDQPLVLGKGEVAVLQTARNSSNDVCTFGISPFIFAKINVDSINLTNRSIFIKTLVNPNCGFHSLKTGVPTD